MKWHGTSLGFADDVDIAPVCQIFANPTPKSAPLVGNRPLRWQAFDEDKTYDLLSKTAPELAYQIFLAAEMVEDSLHYLQGKRKRTLARYAWMTMFALVVRAFQGIAVVWGTQSFTESLERCRHDDELWQSCRGHWGKLATEAIDFLYPIYKQEAAVYLRREGEELTLANFFKNVGYANRLMRRPLPAALRGIARTILRAANAE